MSCDIKTLDDAAFILGEQAKKIAELERTIALMQANRTSLGGIKLFALNSSRKFGQQVASAMNMELSPLEERYHPDKEIYIRPGINVRRSSVFVIQSLYGDNNESVHDKIIKLQFCIGALWDASADEITAVIPYLAYSRSDRKVKSREGVNTKYLARMLESNNLSRVIVMDVHSMQAFQNSHSRCHADNITCRIEFANYFQQKLATVSPGKIGILSPDSGSLKRCVKFQKAMEARLGEGISIAWVDKRHDEKNSELLHSEYVIGEVREHMICFDDMFATCSSAIKAATLAKAQGAKKVYLVATHGLFCGKADQNLLESSAVDKVIVSDSIEPFRLSIETIKAKLEIVPTAHVWADAIQRTYTGDSLSSLFDR